VRCRRGGARLLVAAAGRARSGLGLGRAGRGRCRRWRPLRSCVAAASGRLSMWSAAWRPLPVSVRAVAGPRWLAVGVQGEVLCSAAAVGWRRMALCGGWRWLWSSILLAVAAAQVLFFLPGSGDDPDSGFGRGDGEPRRGGVWVAGSGCPFRRLQRRTPCCGSVWWFGRSLCGGRVGGDSLLGECLVLDGTDVGDALGRRVLLEVFVEAVCSLLRPGSPGETLDPLRVRASAALFRRFTS
jgi:hypothetical protein